MPSLTKEPSTAPATELEELLNRAELRLGDDLRTAKLPGDRLVVKHQPTRGYLVVSAHEWAVLQEFRTGRPVPKVLIELISAQRCPPLREFYQLVHAATQAGVLRVAGSPAPAAMAPAKWPLKLGGGLVRVPSLALVAGSCAALALRPVSLPEHPAWLAAGWLAGCAAASLGNAIAAAVVRASGGDIYRPRLDWKRVFPRFTADLDDALMGGKDTQVNAAAVRLAALFAAAGAAAMWAPGLVVPLLLALLLALSPLWKSPMLDLIAAMYRDPQLATAYGFEVARSRLFLLLGKARRGLADARFLFVCAGSTVIWLAVVFLTGTVLLEANALELVERFNAAGGWRMTALVLLLLIGALVAGAAGAAAWIVGSHVRGWMRERAERRMRPETVLMSPESIAGWLSRTALFRELAAADLAAIAAAVKPEEHKRGSHVVREGEPGEKLYLVVSGRLEVRRDYAPGRSEPVAEMGEGDVFGEIALLKGGVRTRSIRCLEPSVLLGLEKADFERLVLSKMSRGAVEDAVQKVGFLQSTDLTRNWSHKAMAEFAKRSKLREYEEGAVVVKEGENNHTFHIVHRGEFAVKQGKDEVRRLRTGDSFGELSLLGDGIATASVIAAGRGGSCLLINGREFLEFITRDFSAGLQWEERNLRRMGRPVITRPGGGKRG